MMDYAKEYDRMVERSNKQLERIEIQITAIQQLREALIFLKEREWQDDDEHYLLTQARDMAAKALAATEGL